jgi:hypothetical protein
MSFKLTLNGKSFSSADFKQTLEKSVVDVVKRKLPDHLAEKLRDPITGEKPKVSLANNIEKLSDFDGAKATVQGSPELIANIAEQLGDSDKKE